MAIALLAILPAPAAFAQDAAAQQPDTAKKAPTTLDTVVITGTRASDRTVAESLSPIDIITPAALEATGTSELATALSRALPSLNFPRPAITDGTDAVRPAQLRGLAPDQVLVLVNGKRRHTTALINLNGSQGRGSSPVDLNAIPIAAVERVEVLRDGASAQYGSDAIAGVVNIVLKGGGTGGSLEAKYGQYSAGDGTQVQLTGDGGFGFGDGRGQVHVAGQAGHNEQTDRARPVNLAATPLPSPVPPLGRVVQRYGDPEITQGAVSFNGTFDFSDTLALYAFGMASNRDAISNGFFRASNDSRNNPAIYPDGFLPKIHNLSKDRSIVVGLRGTAAGWDWDASYNHGENFLSFKVENSLNRSMGAASPLDFYAGDLEVKQDVYNVDTSKAFEVGAFSGPMTVAFGAEYREERFNQGAGDAASYFDGRLVLNPGPPAVFAAPGAQVFPGFKPADAGHHKRDSWSVYADVEADITEKFSGGIAARYEDYSDFGTTTSGKLSARYAFTPSFALRGTVSTGFRAPSLQQQFFQSTATNFIGGVPFDVRTFAVTDPVAVALGSEPLRPEKSKNYSLGLVMQPMDNLYVTVDAYQIDVEDRIILSENLIGAAVTSFLQAPPRNILGVTGGRYFTNAVDTQTRGIDLVGTYHWALDDGGFDLTASYNHNKTTLERIAPNPPELTSGGLNLNRIGRVEQGRVTVGAPREKFALAGAWNTSHWAFNAAATRYGEFSVLFDPATANRDQTFGAEWTLDVSASYRTGGWTFTVGGDNVTDEYPDEVILPNTTGGQLPYSAASPFGFNGAFVYGKVGYKW